MSLSHCHHRFRSHHAHTIFTIIDNLTIIIIINHNHYHHQVLHSLSPSLSLPSISTLHCRPRPSPSSPSLPCSAAAAAKCMCTEGEELSIRSQQATRSQGSPPLTHRHAPCDELVEGRDGKGRTYRCCREGGRVALQGVWVHK